MTLQDYAPLPESININTEKESYEELISKGMELRELLDVSQWTMGDFAFKVQRDLGSVADEKGYTPLDRLAVEIGVKPATLQQYRWVSASFPNKKVRETNLSWTHYRHASATADPTTWITKAVNENLSSSQLKEMIDESKDKISIRQGKPCAQCGLPLPDENTIVLKRGHHKDLLCSWKCAMNYANYMFAEEMETKARGAA